MSIALQVENVSKLYRLGEIGTGSLSKDLNKWWYKLRGMQDPYAMLGQENDRSQKDETGYAWALRDISFNVNQGEILGIIGRNGAGKSTLLKILSKVTAPTTGIIRTRGRIASLLEVGTGFNPEMTGRENIFLNGAILGMEKAEIKKKFDEIVDFSGVEKYIDTPVKRYSSGMYVRLAFAVAAHLEPEILIVDEVLAVGDAEFQQKCMGKMQDVNNKEGRTVLFVSHNMGAITMLCPNAIFLKNGGIERIGKTDELIPYYLNSLFKSECTLTFETNFKSKGQFLKATLRDKSGDLNNNVVTGDELTLEIEYFLSEDSKNFQVAYIVTDQYGNHIYSSADCDLSPDLLIARKAGNYFASVPVKTMNLNTGTYNISLGMGIPGKESFHRVEAFSFNIVDTGDFGTGKESGRRKGMLLVENMWKTNSKI